MTEPHVPVMRRVVVFLALASLAALPPRPAAAQTVAGRLVDRATRGVVEGVGVKLADSANVIVAQTVSDTSGEFLLNLERPGKYRLYFSAGNVGLGASEPINVSAEDFHQRIYVVDVRGGEPVYFEFQVAKQVAPLPGNRGPRYPEDLRARNIEGEVLAQFVVDTTGRPVAGTLRLLRSTDPGFARAVELVLWQMRFLPAELKDGRRVRQLVQMPFEFTLTR
jgi:TonB family protein